MIATASHRRSTSSSWWLEKTTGTPVRAQVEQHLGEHVDADGVEAGERLVEHQQLGVVDQRGRELHALLVAERELLDAVAGALGEAEPLDPAVGRRGASSVATPCSRAKYVELVADAHLRVQAALLGHVAEARAGREVDRARRSSGPSPRSGSSTPSTMRIVVVLPAPLGPTKPNIWPGSTVKRQPVERHDVAVAAREVGEFQHDVRSLVPQPDRENGAVHRTLLWEVRWLSRPRPARPCPAGARGRAGRPR